MTLSVDKIKKALPLARTSNVEKYADELIAACNRESIYTIEREAAFLSQIGWESMWLSHAEENLNYSAVGIHNVWPGRFPTVASAEPYARNPQKLANKVYSGRYGNGDEASGDGWKYRGRGLIQVTFKTNYKEFGIYANKDTVADPDYLKTETGAVQSAVWYWRNKNLNSYADRHDIVSIVKIISGGTHNIDKRIRAYEVAMAGVSS